MQVIFQQSNADQLKKGELSVLGFCADPTLCPVMAECCYLAIRGEGEGNKFVQRDSTPLTLYQFWPLMKHALEHLGFQVFQSGSHSFCTGTVSTVATMG